MSEWTRRVRVRQVALNLVVTGAVLAGLSCSGGDITQPTTGTLKITTATTGTDPGPDGYAFAVDGGATQPIGVNASVSLADLAVGSHSVGLSGLAQNCTVQGDNPRSVTLAAGATSDMNFAITCTATTGSIQVTTATTGADPDPDGYTASVDGGAAQPIGINATLTVANLGPGSHTVALAGLASNCQLAGDNPRSVTVSVGAMATITFTITCPIPVVARWTPMASGTTSDLLHIAGSSASNIFAVERTGAIRHYDGVSWTPQSAPAIIGRVWANSAVDAFAAGKTDDGRPTLLHYDGQQWSVVFSPPIPPGLENHEFVWGGIWGTGADLFAVGGWFPLDTDLNFPPGYVVHYDGTAWSSALCCGEGVLSGVWGSSKDDVYLIGTDLRNDGTGFIMHKTGDAWVRVLEYPPAYFDAIWGSSASDVYVSASSNFRGAPTLWHFNGTSWVGSALAYGGAGAIWGSSADDIYVLAGGILHFDGASWKKVLDSKTGAGLSDIWGSSSTDVYVVGQNGTILHGTP